MGEAAAADNPDDFNKGKGRTLAGMLLLAAVAIGAFALYLVSDQPNPYGELGKQINGLKSKHFDAFMLCMLPGAQLDALKSDRDLREQLHERARGGGTRYAEHLRTKCAPELSTLASQLHALLPPEDTEAQVQTLASAVADLRRATLAFSDYLMALEDPYSPEAASDQIEPLARAWYAFRKTYSELNSHLRSALGRE